MPRKESEAVPEGNGSVPQQEEFGSGEPTLADVYRLFEERFDRQQKIMDSCFDRQENMLDEIIMKMTRGTSQHAAKLEHNARQPRIAMEADGPTHAKTRECTEGAATAVQAMRGDGFSARRVEPGPKTNPASVSMMAEPPLLPCRDHFLVENGDSSPKSCLSAVEMCKATPAGGLLHAGSASTNKTQGTNFPLQLLPWSFRETSKEKIIGYNKANIRQVQPFLAPKGDRNEIKAKPGF